MQCIQCKSPFEITSADWAFYQKMSVPDPKLCPDCRQQRRLSFRNERSLYHLKSHLSGKQMISMYSPDKPYKVYDQSEWWGDQWDGLTYGRDFDFNRPFFEQFHELMLEVPRINLINREHENSEYCNFAIKNKNSYLLFTSAECEDSYYCNRSWKLKDVCDASNANECELSYEIIDSDHCYHCAWLQNASNCSDCFLGYNLKGCHHCFGCYGLTNASYRVGNKQLTKQAYEELLPSLWKDFKKVQKNYQQHLQKLPRKYIDGINVEDCTGNALFHSKNCKNCFELMNGQDCRYVANVTYMKDSYDINNDDNSELVYEAVGSESNYFHRFNDICWFNTNITYCSLCFSSHDLFGCVGLRHKEYCILNKQYSKEEYEQIVGQIVGHMVATKEWGEFFPSTISPFAYNETMAVEHFPLKKEEVLRRGLAWKDDDGKKSYKGPQVDVPRKIEDVTDDIVNQILLCEVTGKPYKITPQELRLYRKLDIPVPRRCPDQRHQDRLALRNPRKLYARTCVKCSAPIQTTYALNRPEIVYCETCYLKEIY
ncbi:hypothetical protein HZA43_00920 [Candidatus Peregrinibacteria bacterium]|nr:hypothetical protein [Candidatus Peregrinibacteria bacterium]